MKVAQSIESPVSIFICISSPSRKAIASQLQLDGKDVIAHVHNKLNESGLTCTVIDMSFAEQISLRLTREEVASSGSVLLTSHCPGWSLYAEKTQDDSVVNKLSKIRSPDQIAGILVKSSIPGFSRRLSKNPWMSRFARPLNPIYFVCVSPCFDKKLEILRPTYKFGDSQQIVDLVLTTTELLNHLSTITSVTSSNRVVFDLSALLGLRVAVNAAEGGGYADSVAGAEANWVTQRNRDLCFSEKAGRAFGFRNIQNILRRLKSAAGEVSRKEIIEVMACPGACTLGGGQPPPNVHSDKSASVHAYSDQSDWWLREIQGIHRADAKSIFSAEWKSLAAGSSSFKW